MLAPPLGWDSWQELVERSIEASTLPISTRQSMRLAKFETFGNATLTGALRAAQNLAKGEAPLMLTLCGPRGVGKTHLVVAIAWEWIEKGAWVVFQQVDAMLESLRDCYNHDTGQSFTERFQQLLDCHLLILDDLGVQKPTDWAEAKLDSLIDWRYLRGLPLVVATNALDTELAPRIADRLWDTRKGKVRMMKVPSYRRRAP